MPSASEASAPRRVLVVDAHHYCRSRDYAGSYSRADLGGTPQPTLLLGLFGSWLFAKIDLFNLHQTDAPVSLVAAFFLLFAGFWLIVTVIPGFTAAVRRSPPQSGAFTIRTSQVGG